MPATAGGGPDCNISAVEHTCSAPQPYGLIESLPVLIWFDWHGRIWLRCDVADMLVCRRLLSKWLVGCKRSRKSEPQQQDLPAAR